MNQTILNAPPGDGISCLAFSPVSAGNGEENLLVSSWDSTVRLYDPQHNFPKATYNFSAACLACCFDGSSPNISFCGGLDSTVSHLDVSRGSRTTLGNHQGPISSLEYCLANNSL